MDYLPPHRLDRPALVAQASERLLADSKGPVFDSAFGNLGMLDTLPSTWDWVDTTTWKQRMLLHELKPGQRVVFAKPKDAAKPLFFVEQFKPCSPEAFASFEKMIHSGYSRVFDANQLQPLHELFGEKLADKSLRIHAGELDINKRPVLMVNCYKIADNTYRESFFVIADRKKRLIQEIGYEGAIKDDGHWAQQAHDMLMNIELKPEK